MASRVLCHRSDFVGYFYPMRELVPDFSVLTSLMDGPISGLPFFTVATYVNAGWMREQVCLYMSLRQISVCDV